MESTSAEAALTDGNTTTRLTNDQPMTPQEWAVIKKGLLYTARKRAKRKGMVCSINADDIIFPEDGCCPILGEPLKKHRGKMERNTPSLDRKDSTKGYVPGNVYVVSWWANYLKEQMSLEQAKKLVEYIGS